MLTRSSACRSLARSAVIRGLGSQWPQSSSVRCLSAGCWPSAKSRRRASVSSSGIASDWLLFGLLCFLAGLVGDRFICIKFRLFHVWPTVGKRAVDGGRITRSLGQLLSLLQLADWLADESETDQRSPSLAADKSNNQNLNGRASDSLPALTKQWLDSDWPARLWLTVRWIITSFDRARISVVASLNKTLSSRPPFDASRRAERRRQRPMASGRAEDENEEAII